MVLKFLVLVNVVVAAHAGEMYQWNRLNEKDVPMVTINGNTMKLSETHNESLISANTTYEFRENELAYVQCDGPYSNMRFVVQDGPSLPEYNHTSINMFMRMRGENDGKYIDCYYNKSGLESFVRIMLKLNQYDTSEEGASFDLEDLCCQASESQCSTRLLDSTKNYYKQTKSDGLKGFDFSKILYGYCHPMGHKEVHYEYNDKQVLDLTWNVHLIASKSYEYTVYFKDKQVSSLPVIKIKNNCWLSLKLMPIIPGSEDDRSVIKIGTSVTDNRRSDHEEIRIILRRIPGTNDMEAEQDHKDDFMILSFFILVGLACLFIITLVVTICFIVRRKSEATRNTTEDHNYGNLESSDWISPFPSQLETYANAMETRDPDLNSMRRLYATPLPKSQRKVQKNDMYVNASSAGALVVEDGLYSVVDHSGASEMPAPSKEQNYHNLIPSNQQ